MNIAKFAVERPVTVIMILLALFAAGGAALVSLNVDLFPNIEFPMAFIQSPYPGVDPAEMENIVTKKIEDEINTVENIKNINSTSFEGYSHIMVEFKWGTNIDLASIDLREKVDVAKRKLPRDMEQVTVGKFDINASPVFNIALGGDYSLKELRDLADKEIKPAFERINGIANVEIFGGLVREIRVKVDNNKLKAMNISIDDVIKALNSDNRNTPVGNITEGNFRYLIRSEGEAKRPSELGNIIIGEIKDRPVYLSELAIIEDSYKDIESVSRLNDMPAVTMALKKEADANPVKLSDMIKKLVPQIEKKYDGKLKITISQDRSDFIRDSIEMVKSNATSGAILAIIVLILFLKNMRSTFIIGLSIPLAVVITFGFLYMNKMTLNLMTLGGLALGIGMMVDNAIVVLENIYRYLVTKNSAVKLRIEGLLARLEQSPEFEEASVDETAAMIRREYEAEFKDYQCTEEGEKKIRKEISGFRGKRKKINAQMLHKLFLKVNAREEKAELRESSVSGTSEVMLAVLASTLTTMAVFLPIAFVPGIVGEIFFSMSLAIVFSLAASYIVAVILVPMLSSRILKIEKKPNEFIIDILKFFYRLILRFLLCSWITRIAYFIGILYLFKFSLGFMPAMSFFPDMDRRTFIVKFETPEGTSVEETDKVTRHIERILKSIPDVDKITSNSQMGEGSVTVSLFPLEKATLWSTIKEYAGAKKKSTAMSTDEIIKSVRPRMKDVPGYSNMEYSKPKMGGPGGGKPVQIEVSGPDIVEIEKLSIMIAEKIKGVSGLKELESGVKTGRPEIKIIFDREKLRDMDQDLGKVAGMVRSYVFGSLAGKYKESNEEYDIRVEIGDDYKDEIRKLNDLEVILGKGKVVTLSQIARVIETKGYTKIKRKNLKRLVTVQADLENRPIQAVTKDINAILKSVVLPIGYEYRFGGEEEERAEAFGNLGLALIASIVLVYMIMAAQFESFAYPFVIMFTIPLSIIGVILSLNIYGFPFSITAMIGIIMLAGIVVNNGILLIDYTNQRREEFGEINTVAAVNAGCTRLRPILMTTLTTVLGMLPLSLGIGAGADFYQPLAIAVIGGLSVSTLLTLTFIPVTYVIIDNIITRIKQIISFFFAYMRWFMLFLAVAASVVSFIYRNRIIEMIRMKMH